jgi:hypothetical protein
MTPDHALTLLGDGYDVAISPDAYERRDITIAAATVIRSVASNAESAEATFALTKLANLRLEVERARKAVKEPVLAVGRKIDEAARDFIGEVVSEEQRLKSMIEAHAADVARRRAELEAAERRAAQEALRAKEEADRAAASAADSGKLKDVVAAKQAAQIREETLSARVDAADATSDAKAPDAVTWQWDFVVEEPLVLARIAPELVTIQPQRAEILRELKERAASNHSAAEAWALLRGIRAFLKPVARKFHS